MGSLDIEFNLFIQINVNTLLFLCKEKLWCYTQLTNEKYINDITLTFVKTLETAQ